jgi:hypothetical protein
VTGLAECRSVPVISGFVHTAFFEQAGSPGSYLASAATAGPWSAQAQHGGPPSALAVREIERDALDDGMRVARVSVDILRPVPVGAVTITTRTLRPGKRVTLAEAVMQADGRDVLCARAWRVVRTDGVPVITGGGTVPEIPAASGEPRFPGGHIAGYLSAIDWRFVSGSFDAPGPCRAWARPRIPLLAGEDISPMCLALLLGDSGSGVGMAVDPRQFQAINVDLTVVLQRDPAGEWLLLDARTTMGGQGTGLAETQLSDQAGVVGTGLQTLVVSRV